MSRRKILFLQKRLLYPTDSGGKIRTLNVLRHLAKWHDITYLCNILPAEQSFLGEMEAIGIRMETIPWVETPRNTPRFYFELAQNLVSRYPFNVNKDFDPRLRARAAELLQQQQFDLLICDFVQMARNCIGFCTIPKLLFQHNVEAQIFQRHYLQDSGTLRRLYMWLQWKKMHRFEKQAGRDFDTVIAVSDQDRSTFERNYGWTHTRTIDTAVDTEFFTPRRSTEIRHRYVFIGSMDWLPNEDGVHYFVREVWPRIRQRFPHATFAVVGRNPSRSLLALNDKDGIEVTGSVPDVRPYLAEAEVVVAPLLVGGGTRLKVFEAMAMKKAVVSTTLGVEGLDVTHEKHLLIADDSRSFAEAMLRLSEDQDLRSRLTGNALALVRDHHTASAIARQFNTICNETVDKRPAVQAASDRQ